MKALFIISYFFMKEFFLQKVQETRKLASQHQFSIAEKKLQELLLTPSISKNEKSLILKELYQINLRVGKAHKAINHLESLALESKEEPLYWLELYNLSESLGETDKAIRSLEKYIENEPECSPDIYFNLAYNLKLSGDLKKSLRTYQKSLDKDISAQEEVYTNIGVIYSELREENKAIESFQKALELNGMHTPALLNLAGIYEESGEKKKAIPLYQEVLSIDRKNSLALARMAHMYTAKNQSDTRIKNISALLNSQNLSDTENEELYFALGKLYDDCQLFSKAFSCISQANNIGRKRTIYYNPIEQEKLTDDLINTFSKEWFTVRHSQNKSTPIFICGMLRSGSTLLEQMLCGHSCILSTGERDFVVRKIEEMRGGYPQSVLKKDSNYFTKISKDYFEEIGGIVSGEQFIIDKRPENFLHIGLIKTAFPKSKIIWTRRNLLDNAISIYFQQLNKNLNYSFDLEQIAHFYSEHIRLMKYWESLFPGDLYQIQYEDLVTNPKTAIGSALNFLGLCWDPNCLEFSQRRNHVKTASIWQVREPIYLSSVNRSNNYLEYLTPLNLKRFLK
ncbi:tetratricopeptide repeat-containing sulfotransferase family protein [Microbulbifer sp. CnH-101-G]|uniref:tetratricopeptide repeat-containing sulfotransferase family protein n=1 Tax=Microbulbifer sp. CnH-101-G TaxID=3243393 RepID=UPI00403A7ABF